MSNPTTPFGWQMPTATDLVTDLPADFEVFGQAVATSMADLLGGTSGQVLAKNSNTDMDFVWVTSDDANAIQNSIVDAKGDLIAASAADTPARLAVGSNGETLVADSSTSTGLRYQATQAAGKNYIINGGMDVWQRGTSFTGTATAYGPDRFMVNRNTTGSTFSRQTSTQTGFTYAIRCQRDVSTTATNSINLAQNIESLNSVPLAGQTITLSFYAKAGANFSAASSQIAPQIYSGTGTDQNIFTGFTGQATLLSTTATLTTSFQRFSYTATVGSTATELAIIFGFTPVGTAGANDWFEVTGVQLEIGSVATNFTRAGGTIQGELAACQRYYYRVTADRAFSVLASGFASSTTVARLTTPFPVTMRVQPTAVEWTTLSLQDYTSSWPITDLGMGVDTSYGSKFQAAGSAIVTSGLTAFRPYSLIATNSTSAYIGWSAEL